MQIQNYTITSAVPHLLRLSRRLNLSSHATMMSCPRRGPSPLDRFAVRHFRVGPSRKAVAASHFHFCHRKPRYAARRRPFAPPPLAHFPTSRPGRVASRRAQRGISHSSSAHDFYQVFQASIRCRSLPQLHPKIGPQVPEVTPPHFSNAFAFFVLPTNGHTHFIQNSAHDFRVFPPFSTPSHSLYFPPTVTHILTGHIASKVKTHNHPFRIFKASGSTRFLWVGRDVPHP